MPAELVKARMQTQSFETLGQCLKDAIGKERGGFFGLYTGYTATMIRDLPYFALQLGFYGTVLIIVAIIVFVLVAAVVFAAVLVVVVVVDVYYYCSIINFCIDNR